jgi:uncharacterized protein with ATP-grasp and redox domains
MMKVKEGFVLKEVAGSYVIVPIGENLIDFSAMITTNETGAFIWNLLKEERSINDLLSELLKEYDVDEETARADILEFLKTLKENKVLED